jgi:hypothetical protein
MVTLTVPATTPPVEEDCEQLRNAFKGPPRASSGLGIFPARISLRMLNC